MHHPLFSFTNTSCFSHFGYLSCLVCFGVSTRLVCGASQLLYCSKCRWSDVDSVLCIWHGGQACWCTLGSIMDQLLCLPPLSDFPCLQIMPRVIYILCLRAVSFVSHLGFRNNSPAKTDVDFGLVIDIFLRTRSELVRFVLSIFVIVLWPGMNPRNFPRNLRWAFHKREVIASVSAYVFYVVVLSQFLYNPLGFLCKISSVCNGKKFKSNKN